MQLKSEPGAWVEAGQELASLSNPELELAIREVEAQVSEARSRARRALAEDPSQVPVLDGYLSALRERLAELYQRRDSLMVVAPHEGWWAAAGIEDLVGGWVSRGAALGEVLDTRAFEFRVEVPVDRVPRLVESSTAQATVRLNGQPWRRLSIGESRLVAASSARKREDGNPQQETVSFFEFRGEIADNGGAELLHGQAGQIRFKLAPESLWNKLSRLWREFLEKRTASM